MFLRGIIHGSRFIFANRFRPHLRCHMSNDVKLSDSCVEKLKKMAGKSSLLRVTVEGGGCSGFQYKFNLDEAVGPTDTVFERDGARIVVDETSLSLLHGSTVDYHEELIRSSFRVVDNPQAEKGCSCGASFTIKL